jgi:hypothetical protein
VPEFADLDAVLRSAGTSLGAAEWCLATQQQVAELAEATATHEWIHLDEHRAARESPFGQCVACRPRSRPAFVPIARSRIALTGKPTRPVSLYSGACVITWLNSPSIFSTVFT